MADLDTTLHHFTVPSGSTLDRFDTEDGALWRQALLFTAEQSGWKQTAWARHHEDRNRVTVWIDWYTAAAASAFCTGRYHEWVQMFAPLVAGPVETHQAELAVCTPIPVWHPGFGPTTIYQFKFSTDIHAEERTSLLQPYREHLQDLQYHRSDAVMGGFEYADESWVDNPAPEEPGSVLYLALVWESFEAMQRLTEIDREENRSLERYLQPILATCDAGWQYFNVEWDVLWDGEVEWWKAAPNPRNPLEKSE